MSKTKDWWMNTQQDEFVDDSDATFDVADCQLSDLLFVVFEGMYSKQC